MAEEKFKIRALTRGEARKFREMVEKDGFSDKSMDFVFEAVFGKDLAKEIDGLAYPKAIKLYREILGETYGSEVEEKNS